MWSLSQAKSIAMSIQLLVRSRVILQLTRSFRLLWTIVRWRIVVKWTIIGITLSGVFFPILCVLSTPGSGISTFKWLNNSLHLSNTSSEVSEPSLLRSKILRQSLFPHYCKLSHFLTRWEGTALETSNEFSHSMRDSSSLSIIPFWELTVSVSYRIKLDWCWTSVFMSDMLSLEANLSILSFK